MIKISNLGKINIINMIKISNLILHLDQKVHTFQASLEAVLAQLCDAEFAQVYIFCMQTNQSSRS